MAIFSVRFLWRARTRGGGGGGGFPYSVEHMAGEGQPAQAARPNIVHVYGACAVCRCVLVRIYGGVFMRDSGRSL